MLHQLVSENIQIKYCVTRCIYSTFVQIGELLFIDSLISPEKGKILGYNIKFDNNEKRLI